MSITSITIENFKGIKDKVKIDFKPITLLFGPNSAGKSTIIQALHYLKQIFVNKNPDADVSFAYDGNIRFGGFKNLVHGHDFRNNIKLALKINRKRFENDDSSGFSGIFENKLIQNEENIVIEICICWDSKKDIPVVYSYSLFVDGEKLIENKYNKDEDVLYLVYFDHNHKIFDKTMTHRGIPVDEDLGLKSELKYTYREAFKKVTSNYFNKKSCNYDYKYVKFLKSNKNDNYFPVLRSNFLEASVIEYYADEYGNKYVDDPALGWLQKFVLDKLLIGSYKMASEELSDCLRIGPLREMPDRIEANQVPNQQRFITGRAAWDILYAADDVFIDKFNYWISSEDKLNTGYSAYHKNIIELDRKKLPENVTLESLSSLTIGHSNKKLVFKDSNDVEVMPQDVGFGFSQILPIVVAALMGENETKHIYFGNKEHKKIISIEQPELHIHPRLQVELGDLFVEQSVNKNVIFLIETHSEHLILRILRRIRETSEGELEEGATPITPDQVSVLYVQPDKKGSQVLHIPVNEEGEFDRPWPQGFFAERARELF